MLGAIIAGRRNIESSDGTDVTTVGPTINASPTPGSPGRGNILSISGGAQILLNGAILGGASVVELYYTNHTAYQKNASNSWYGPITASGTGSSVADPRTTIISGITLTNSSFTGGSASGTVVGTIAVTTTQGAFSGSLSLSGTDASAFQIVGTSLETQGVDAAGSYSINIVATQAGATGSPFTQAETITGTGATIAYATGANPGTNPTTNGFPSPLPFSSVNVAGQATSPVGWTVDMFDDFNGTFNLITNSYLTTGATYSGSLIRYWKPSLPWGGYGGTSDFTSTLLSMSGSALVMQSQYISGAAHVTGVQVQFNSPWGYWEASSKMSLQADGNHGTIDYGIWLANPNWPTAGEFDIIETLVTGNAVSGGIGSTIHLGTSVNNDNLKATLSGSNTLPGGAHWWDGNFHIYGCFITPSWLAVYVDGSLILWTNSSTFLNNLSTATNPPSGSAAGSFGYNPSILTQVPSSTSMGNSQAWLIGPGGTIGSPTSAMFPCTQSIDWLRHSLLNPATGGPHV